MNTTLSPSPSSSSSQSGAIYWRVTMVSLVAAATLALTACAGMSPRERDVAVGATAGAVIGGVATGSTTGAVVGGAVGGVVGNEVSKKKGR